MTSVGSGVAAAQQDLALDVEVPTEATVGETVTVSATVSVPDLVGSYESELTVTMYVDGEKVSSRTVTVEDGETSTVSFGHSFDAEGTYMVTIEGAVSVAGQTFSDSISRDIDVSAMATALPSATPSSPEVIETSVEGAAFVVPESLAGSIETYRDQSPVELGANAFVLATNEELYVVFTDAEPTAGLATVEGVSPDVSISAQGLSFTVLVASSTSFDTQGSTASVREIAATPEEYQYDLVRVRATHRRVSTITDPDQGSDPTLPSSSGVLAEDSDSTRTIFAEPGHQARALVVNTSTDKVGSSGATEVRSVVDSQQPRLLTVGFETAFWTETEMTVDGIVLTPGSSAFEFVTAFDEAGIVRTGSGEPLLYVVDTHFEPETYDTISTLKSQASDGGIVSINARFFGQQISVQETLEHSTPCGVDVAQIPTPGGPLCVDVLQDTHIHAGAAWTTIPETDDEVLLVVGLSSHELDSPTEPIRGEYRLVGEIVSTSRIDESLPDGRILVIYDLQRIGGMDYGTVSEQGRTTIESAFSNLETSLESQIEFASTEGTSQTESSGQSDSATEGNDSSGEAESSSEEQGEQSSVEIGEPISDGIISDIADVISGIADAISGISKGMSDVFG